ncbi:MAG TPA: hypothetical protein VHV55_09025 [Pirellulales bacterium]|jgi:hypothetical protein|nr:hypothetical protein [Pirellulales bacterium]
MSDRAESINSLDELSRYVHHTLCDRERLEPGAFAFSERILVRSGRPCGIFFRLRGPRAVQSTAIWDCDRNTVLFYDSSGQRFETVRLATTPQLQLQTA